jgi:hypothetical protein
MKHYYDIKPSDRLAGLGFSETELRLSFFFEKSKKVAKQKLLIKKNIINTQKKGWN